MNKIKFFNKKIEYFFKILRTIFISDHKFVSKKFKEKFHCEPNLLIPATLNEKIIHRMLNDDNIDFKIFANKIFAHKYVTRHIGEKYVVPMLGIYKNFNDIDFTLLPNKFVLKCNHDSGSAIVCKDKCNFDIAAARNRISFHMSRDMYYITRERHYRSIEPMIICEKFINSESDEQLNMGNAKINMLRLHCFDGQIGFIEADISEYSKSYTNVYDRNWAFIDVRVGAPNLELHLPQPTNFEDVAMKSMKLTKQFDYCRLDWHITDSGFYFSEFTFTPCAGRIEFSPKHFDSQFGSLWHKIDRHVSCKKITSNA